MSCSAPIATLASASPADLVQLSAAALQLQQVDGIFGFSPPGSSATASLPAGISTADLANASAEQQAQMATATIQQQQVQALFSTPSSTAGTVSLVG